ncbi:MAG TPA: FAD binding domain-containing protein [Thermoplasmata archaeon]|nr:FAD binding domain-containing protein [Thermoplasmata archaeon]
MGFSLVVPSTPEEAVRELAREPGAAVPLGGGSDLLLDFDDGRATAPRVVSLRRLPWRTIRWADGSLVVGATAPLSDLEDEPRLRSDLPGLWRAVGAVGGRALRHRATLGGNLGRASPVSDLIPVLLALDARVSIVGPSGRRDLSVDDLIVGSRQTRLAVGELIESVTVPSPAESEYVWQRVRLANDISQVGVAVARFEGGTPVWRIALSGVTPRPRRLREAEALLGAAQPSRTAVELAAQEAARRAPFASDKRATEPYRRRLVQVLVRRAVEAVAHAPRPARPPAKPPARTRNRR